MLHTSGKIDIESLYKPFSLPFQVKIYTNPHSNPRTTMTGAISVMPFHSVDHAITLSKSFLRLENGKAEAPEHASRPRASFGFGIHCLEEQIYYSGTRKRPQDHLP